VAFGVLIVDDNRLFLETARDPGTRGPACRRLGRGGGAAVILIFTHSEADFADLIAESPAAGFLSKGDLSAHAIRRIVDGGEPGDPPGARRR
jgi:hypothetical protein